MRSRIFLPGWFALSLGLVSLGCNSAPPRRVDDRQRSNPRPNQLNPPAMMGQQSRPQVPSDFPGISPGGVVPAGATAPAPPVPPAPLSRGLSPTVPESNPGVPLPLKPAVTGTQPAPLAPAATPQLLPGQTMVQPAPALQPPAPPGPPAASGQTGPQSSLALPTALPVASNTPARTTTATNPTVSTAEPQSSKLRQLQQQAAEKYAKIDSYVARLQRREQVNGKNSAEEVILFSHRKKPWSVHLKWIGTEAQGRESIYVKDHYEGKIHTLLAPTDPRILGKIVAMPPDSPFIRSRTRHPITEAGIGPLIDRFGQLVEREERGQSHALRYAGPVKRAEHDLPLEAVEQVIGERDEAALPGGGRRWWHFDPVSSFPILIVTLDSAGQQVEYYCYDKFLMPASLDDDDFNPERLGKGRR